MCLCVSAVYTDKTTQVHVATKPTCALMLIPIPKLTILPGRRRRLPGSFRPGLTEPRRLVERWRVVKDGKDEGPPARGRVIKKTLSQLIPPAKFRTFSR